jgi:hypothetical protein
MKCSDKQLTNNPSHFKLFYIDGSRQATKINIICDQNEVPLSVIFTPANVNDSSSILHLLKWIIKSAGKSQEVLYSTLDRKSSSRHPSSR